MVREGRATMSTPPAQRQWRTWIGVGLAIRVIFLVTGLGLTPVGAQTAGVLAIPADDFAVDGDSQSDASIKGAIAVRSAGGQLARTLQMAIQSGIVPVQGSPTEGQSDSDNGNGRGDVDINKQVNNPALDHTVTFPGARPFEFSLMDEHYETEFNTIDCRAFYTNFRPFEVDVKFEIRPPVQ